MKGTREVTTREEILAVMRQRHRENANAIWMSFGSELYPVLLVLIVDDYANVHFMPGEGLGEKQAIGGDLGLDLSAQTLFFTSLVDEPTAVNNTLVVSASDALSAAWEFARTAQIPRTLRWMSL